MSAGSEPHSTHPDRATEAVRDTARQSAGVVGPSAAIALRSVATGDPECRVFGAPRFVP